MMPEVEHFSMASLAFLEIVEMIEEYGTFTPANSTDGLQMFDVATSYGDVDIDP